MIKHLTIRGLVSLLLLSALGSQVRAADMKLVTYESSDAIIANPERGLFKHFDFPASSSNRLNAASIKAYRSQGITMLYTGYILDTFRDGSDISEAYLERVRGNMEALREAGMKCVARFYYSADSSSKPWDMPAEVSCRHIAQLTPILREYSDVIALVEAGFVGVWGEWAFTDNHHSNPATAQDYESRRLIVQALADALPADRFISLRTPMAKMGVLSLEYGDTITNETAYDGSIVSRVGHHNDCFLANADDAGTYRNKQANRRYTADDSRYTPMGGETCSDANQYTEQANAMQDFAKYHWSYLNADYHPGALSSWESTGFMDDIRRNLGYRFALIEGEYTESAPPGGEYQAMVTIQNQGWASPYNPRPLEMVLVNMSKRTERYTFPIEVDPRRWTPGSTTTLSVCITLPDEMSEGEYQVYLNLPDPSDNLKDKIEFKIRMANGGSVWDARTGMNRLATLNVSHNSAVDQPTAHDTFTTDDTAAPVYDLAGRRVGSVSTISQLTPGIYIYHGMKVRLPRR